MSGVQFSDGVEVMNSVYDGVFTRCLCVFLTFLLFSYGNINLSYASSTFFPASFLFSTITVQQFMEEKN